MDTQRKVAGDKVAIDQVRAKSTVVMGNRVCFECTRAKVS